MDAPVIAASSLSAELTLLTRLVVSWFMDDEGFREFSREAKLEKINKLIAAALDKKEYGVAGALIAELQRLSVSTPP